MCASVLCSGLCRRPIRLHRTSLISELPRRVLLGNSASGFWSSTAIIVLAEPVEEHVCLALPWISLFTLITQKREEARTSCPRLFFYLVSFPRFIRWPLRPGPTPR